MTSGQDSGWTVRIRTVSELRDEVEPDGPRLDQAHPDWPAERGESRRRRQLTTLVERILDIELQARSSELHSRAQINGRVLRQVVLRTTRARVVTRHTIGHVPHGRAEKRLASAELEVVAGGERAGEVRRVGQAIALEAAEVRRILAQLGVDIG